MGARTWLANDTRLMWTQTSRDVIQLMAQDGGTCGSVVRTTTGKAFAGSTALKYLGQFSDAKSARAAVEKQFKAEQLHR